MVAGVEGEGEREDVGVGDGSFDLGGHGEESVGGVEVHGEIDAQTINSTRSNTLLVKEHEHVNLNTRLDKVDQNGGVRTHIMVDLVRVVLEDQLGGNLTEILDLLLVHQAIQLGYVKDGAV